MVATDADAAREGPYGRAGFAPGVDGTVTYVEIRGPDYKGFTHRRHQDAVSARPGKRTAFPSRAHRGADRDALSVAAIEDLCADAHYAATGGGRGPDTTVAIECLLTDMALLPGATLCCATDANRAGNRHAAHHAQLAAGAGVVFERSRPPDLLTGTVSSKRSA